MADTTTRYSWPYQESTDPPDGAAVGQDLAEAIEATVGDIDDRVTDVDDRVTALEGNPVLRLEQATSQTGLTSGSDTVYTFGTGSTIIDSHNCHSESVNNTRFTPNKAGRYRLHVKAVYAFNQTITAMHAFFRKNGTIVDRSGNVKFEVPHANNINVGISHSMVVEANGTTDYFECGSSFSSGSTQSTNSTAGAACVFEAEWIGPL